AGCATEPAWERMLPDFEEYFQRTRPGEPPPPWLGQGWQPRYVDFLIHLTPGAGPAHMPRIADGLFRWEFREPVRCPLGLPVVQDTTSTRVAAHRARSRRDGTDNRSLSR